VTPERWQEVKAVFTDALKQTPGERRAYLDQVCEDTSLRNEVESLLAAHENAGSSFLERQLVGNLTMLESGTKLGPYEILSRLGAGGMGVVYRARDGRLERDVAIKVLSPGLLPDEAARKRFNKEALALAKLNHPNIATVYDVGEVNNTDYLVMECVPGHSLDEESKSRPVIETQAVALGVQIALALEEAHEHRIVHRDLKPGNIMVTPKGQVKVLDFGLAKFLWAPGDSDVTESFTQTQNMAGTLPYMAPEQLRGEPADARTDLHALGAVLFEIVTGKRLYQEGSVPRLTDAILHQQPVAPRSLNARVSPELERIILKCLEKDRENRYQSAKELGVDLRRLSSSSADAAAARPASRRRVALPAIGALLVATGLLIGGYLYFFHRAPKLTEKDSIVLADFTNTTGDSVFDGTLRQGLSAQLEQTPFLQLVSDDQVAQTLRLMQKPPDTRLTQDLAREVCQRVNATTAIEGSIATLGNQYVIGLNAVNCQTGEALAQEQVTADRKEKVLAALGGAASKLRSKLGESRASLERFDAPLDQVTTPSLEALQAWGFGSQALVKVDIPSAISFLQRAVSLDPNFAQAYSTLGITYLFAGQDSLAGENLTKGYELRDRASEREKFSISGNYNVYVTGDMDKAAQIGEQWTKLFPRDMPALFLLETSYRYAGRGDEALAAARESLRLVPSAWGYYSVVHDYKTLGRFDEARAMIQQAEANHVDPGVFRDLLYQLAFLQKDSALMAEQLAGPWVSSGGPGAADYAQSDTAAYYGHLARARELARRAIASAKQQGTEDVAERYQVDAALREALFGNFPEAQKSVKDAGNLIILQTEGEAAIVWALSGDTAQAQKLADDLSKRFPEATYVRFGYLPAIRGMLAVRRGNAQEAIENLRGISSHELLTLGYDSQSPLVPVYLSGQAYLAANQGAEAAAEFQTIIDHAGMVGNAPIGALAHVGLARAYALQARSAQGADAQAARAKALAADQDFLTLWKDADPDIPILKQVKAEYSKLQ
jgi:serine/threonine protein kinase/tetratricopeptide (TPR) repeat protein